MEDKKLVIVGTAHVSKKSVEEVLNTIEKEKPDAVAVELCYNRYRALFEGVRENISVIDLLKSGNTFLFIFQAILAYMQKDAGRKYGIEPGSEMIAAINKAKEIGADVLLIDRDIGVTFRRFWSSIGIFEKFKLLIYFFKDLLFGKNLELDELLEKDVIDLLVNEFKKISPKAAEILIDERDKYMAYNLSKALQRYNRVVAVVGAGHVRGIEENLKRAEEIDVQKLLEIKKGKNYAKILALGISIFIIAIFVLLALVSFEHFFTAFLYWFLINGILAGLGAALAGAHPFSIITAFFTAWLTSLNPLVASGWISGAVEAWIRKPGVEDLVKLVEGKNLLKNNFFRVLLVAALTNVGSMVGTIFGSYYILTHFEIDITATFSEILSDILRIIGL